MLDQNFLESEMKKVDYQFRHVLGVPSSNMMATMKTLKKNIKKIFIYFAIFISGCIFFNSDFKSYRTAAKFISSFFLATIGL